MADGVVKGVNEFSESAPIEVEPIVNGPQRIVHKSVNEAFTLIVLKDPLGGDCQFLLKKVHVCTEVLHLHSGNLKPNLLQRLRVSEELRSVVRFTALKRIHELKLQSFECCIALDELFFVRLLSDGGMDDDVQTVDFVSEAFDIEKDVVVKSVTLTKLFRVFCDFANLFLYFINDPQFNIGLLHLKIRLYLFQSRNRIPFNEDVDFDSIDQISDVIQVTNLIDEVSIGQYFYVGVALRCKLVTVFV
jgi:hypothetical protein